MAVPTIQTSLAAGEISPELYGEVDLKKFASSGSTIRNFLVNYKGGAISRPGLAFVGRCKQTSTAPPPRAIPFQFSITQGYILEFGDGYVRFVFRGGYVLEDPVAITGASQADPCVISLSGTPFADGDWVFANGVAGMTELNRNTYIVGAVAGGSLALFDLNGAPVDSTAFGAYVSGGTLSRLYTIASPYAAVDLPYLKVSQSADVMSLTCSNPVTGTEYPPYTLTRLSAVDWVLAQVNFDSVVAAPGSVSAAANAQAPTNGVNATFAYQVTAVDREGNESVASAIATCHGADLEVEAGTNAITWNFVPGAAYYNVYRAPPSVDTGTGDSATPNPVPPGSIFGFVGSSYGTQFLDTRSVADLQQTPPTHQNPFARGQILAVDITGGGSGLTSVDYVITTAAGADFSGTPALIAGSLGAFLITDNGQLFQPGDTIAFNGAGFASGAIEFGSTNPSANDTLSLNGVTWTFVAAITGPEQTVVGGALSATLAQLVSGLSSSANPALIPASYGVDITGANLLISYKTAGTGGNAYTLAASRATPSGATLTGGSGSGSAGVNSSGNLVFTLNPTPAQTIVLNGVTWTFVASGATGNQTNIAGMLGATLAQLVIDLTASADANIQMANYSNGPTTLFVVYQTVGTVGNSYTLDGGTAAATPSAPTLTGGANASTIPTATLDVGPTSGTYPGVNAFFQQRQFYANSFNNPDTFWASRTGLYKNFDTSIPVTATDAITASPWTEQVNGIQWLIPMPGGLIAMTGSRAWQIIGEGSYQLNVQPVTPATTQAQPQAFNGCSATIPPIVIDYDVIYVEAIGNTTVRDLSWNFWVNIYTGADLTILSSHLFLYRQITQWTWARNPYKVLWACCDDGTLLSMTYLKEQEVYGWARHDTQGQVVSIASVTEPPVNAVYTIVKRFIPSDAVPGPPGPGAGDFFGSSNGNAKITGNAVSVTTRTVSKINLGMQTPGAHIQFLGLYSAAQIADLQYASNGAHAPPVPAAGTGTFYADFVAGVYYLNGVACTLADLFVPNTVDNFCTPPALTIDGGGAYIAALDVFQGGPVAGGSCGLGTPAVVAAFQARLTAGDVVVILKYSLDVISVGYGAVLVQTDATAGFSLQDEGSGPALSIAFGGGTPIGVVVAGDTSTQQVAAQMGNFFPTPSPIALGSYFMERLDNRLWQTVEDAYAVDSGVSNPMTTPQTALYASTPTGTGATFATLVDAFTTASVGQIIRMGGGIARITAFVSTIEVTGDWVLAATNGPWGAPFAAAGDWTVAAPVISLNAPHLAGMTLVGLADGAPVSGLVVGPTGTVTLPFAASNVKVGLPFLPQLQTAYLNGQGVAQGSRKVIPAATVRVAASAPFQVGTNQPDGAAQNPQQLGPAWTNMADYNPLNATGGQSPPISYTTPGGATATPLWTGDLRGIGGGAAWESKGQIAVQQPLPMALEVVSIEPEILPGDAPENTYAPQQGGGQQQPRGPGRHMIGPRL